MGNRVRWAFALAAVLAVSTCLSAPQAFAGEPYGGVEVMTVSGQHLTGSAAARAYEQFLADEKTINCGSCRKFVSLSGAKMPFIIKNITDAFARGKPFVLHKLDGKPNQNAKRAAACAPFNASYPGGSCDEYPFASSMEGGAGAHIMEVPLREQLCQGGTLAREYLRQNITQGVEYGVILFETTLAANGPYRGVDIAKDRGSC